MSRPMNDDEVLNELNKMVRSTREGREIKVKADEEFAIEKAKLVKQEQLAIDSQYEKKLKGAQVSQKIAQSTLTNKSRLRLLHRREEHLQDLFSSCREQVVSLSSSDSDTYAEFLAGVLTQGYLYLMEQSVVIHSRKSDVSIVEEAASSAAERYKETSGRSIKFDVKGTLSDDIAGGIKLVSGSGRITLDNTLDERLRLLEDRMLPEIRKDLFGPNENRKFYT
ncbi:ATPase, V1/A1 complex, subunit E [Rhodocollybia butyracea]|uniref:ATPase, V1/A1 complex, subunit E n=1 Tax=Rhodocollybia butyracea TaxID=206335 RepID=A0A9P5Q516_9AGAR|nr:ATPase, V1/A1 complex, subunit E [Rhodocollybia butyracea]